MTKKFIYVFTQEDCAKLKSQGFDLINEDKLRSVFIFKNRPCRNFSVVGGKYVLSNTLTFA